LNFVRLFEYSRLSEIIVLSFISSEIDFEK